MTAAARGESTTDLGAVAASLERRLGGRLAEARVVRARELHCRVEPGQVRSCG
jgi:hypothetical protein